MNLWYKLLEKARVDSFVAAFVERHSHLVYRIALAVARNPHDARTWRRRRFSGLSKGGWTEIDDSGIPGAGRLALAVRRRRPRMMGQDLPRRYLPPKVGPEQQR